MLLHDTINFLLINSVSTYSGQRRLKCLRESVQFYVVFEFEWIKR